MCMAVGHVYRASVSYSYFFDKGIWFLCRFEKGLGLVVIWSVANNNVQTRGIPNEYTIYSRMFEPTRNTTCTPYTTSLYLDSMMYNLTKQV